MPCVLYLLLLFGFEVFSGCCLTLRLICRCIFSLSLVPFTLLRFRLVFLRGQRLLRCCVEDPCSFCSLRSGKLNLLALLGNILCLFLGFFRFGLSLFLFPFSFPFLVCSIYILAYSGKTNLEDKSKPENINFL